jgi:hypothetical protein
MPRKKSCGEKNKTVVRKIKTKFDWRRVVALTVIVGGCAAIAAYAWYYITVSRMLQESVEGRRQVEAVEAAMREKYCGTLPYPNEVVRKFCAQPPLP